VIEHEILAKDAILVVRPEGPLSAEDFRRVAADADAYIASRGPLNGLMIQARSFPGWEDLAAFLSHLKFVREHHRQIARVAVVSDSPILRFGPKIAAQFVKAEIHEFPYDAEREALAWLKGGS